MSLPAALPTPPALAPGARCALVAGVRSNSLARAERDWVDSPAWGSDAVRPAIAYGRGDLDALPADSLDVIVVGQDAAETDAPGFWGSVRRALAQGGRVIARFPAGAVDPEAARARLVIGGFVDARVDPRTLLGEASRPAWKQDDAVPLKKRAKAPAASIALIDEDALLDDCGGRAGAVTANDLAGVPLKKAACKNCTCGLKELESKSEDVRVLVDARDASALAGEAAAGGGGGGCGSCAKGDAFRCGGCPYLGLPAFTPGTRPEIVTRDDGTRVLKLDVESDVF